MVLDLEPKKLLNGRTCLLVLSGQMYLRAQGFLFIPIGDRLPEPFHRLHARRTRRMNEHG